MKSIILLAMSYAPEFAPIFRKRLTESLAQYDMRDGKADWSSESFVTLPVLFSIVDAMPMRRDELRQKK